jgi:hypothetical protein
MTCKYCDSEALSSFPADVRLYVNVSRTISAPPMSPAPIVHVCLNCGAAEFSVPHNWLLSGWLRPMGEVVGSQEATERRQGQESMIAKVSAMRQLMDAVLVES